MLSKYPCIKGKSTFETGFQSICKTESRHVEQPTFQSLTFCSGSSQELLTQLRYMFKMFLEDSMFDGSLELGYVADTKTPLQNRISTCVAITSSRHLTSMGYCIPLVPHEHSDHLAANKKPYDVIQESKCYFIFYKFRML